MTLDTSVLVSASDRDHDLFEYAKPAALEAQGANGRLIAHTIAETYSTLTDAPFSRRLTDAMSFLRPFLGRAPVGIEPSSHLTAVAELADHDIFGAAVYDGLIAIVARDAQLTLLSLDRRARRIYETVGVDFRLLQE